MKAIEDLRKRTRELKIETYALYFAYRDSKVSWYAKVFSALVVAYAFSPIDLIPDPIPILGYLDDLILVPLGITLAVKMIPKEVMAEARLKAESLKEKGAPKNLWAAAIIVIIWLLLAALVLRWILRIIKET